MTATPMAAAKTTVTHGFALIREQNLPDINSTARYYRHVATGAELISLVNADENKVFGVSFSTPPATPPASRIFLSTRCCAGRANIPSRSRSSS